MSMTETNETNVELMLAEITNQIADLQESVRALVAPEVRPLLNVPEVARRLNISVKGCWNIVRSGDLPSVVIGEGRRMIEPAALDSYIASRRGLTGATDSG
jgi:hypothetical protein